MITKAPWQAQHDPCRGIDPVTGRTYGQDWPITGNVPGVSLDGQGDYKACFARVRFADAMPIDDQKAHAALMAAAPILAESVVALLNAIAYGRRSTPRAELQSDIRAAMDALTAAGLDPMQGAK